MFYVGVQLQFQSILKRNVYIYIKVASKRYLCPNVLNLKKQTQVQMKTAGINVGGGERRRIEGATVLWNRCSPRLSSGTTVPACWAHVQGRKVEPMSHVNFMLNGELLLLLARLNCDGKPHAQTSHFVAIEAVGHRDLCFHVFSETSSLASVE